MNSIQSYQDALCFLYNRNQFSIKLGLKNIRALLECCQNPHQKQMYIHVGGTNGKGSTSYYLSQLLPYYKYQKIGLYTSPHLIDFRERILINQKMISKEWILKWLQKYQTNIIDLSCTYFEVVTALALFYFKSQKCDIVILEVGLGGRLDSTNIVSSQLSIITSVDYDHCDILGYTLSKIWEEKIGIIQPQSFVVTGEHRSSLQKRIKERCKEINTNLKIIETKNITKTSIKGLKKIIQLPKNNNFSKTHLKNLNLAFQSLEFWKGEFPLKKMPPLKSKIGCQTVFKCPNNNIPITLFDGGHNPQGIDSLIDYINTYFPNYSWTILFSHLKDKDYSNALEKISSLKINSKYFLEMTTISRHLSFKDVKTKDNSWLLWSHQNSIAKTLTKIKGLDSNGLLVCGSFYLLGKILPRLKAIYNENSTSLIKNKT